MSSISSVSGQVAVAVGFFTRDPSLIWNTASVWDFPVMTSLSVNKWYILTARDLTRRVPQEKFRQKPYNNSFIALTKLVRSKWLNIGLVLVLRIYGARLRLGP